MKTFDLSVLPWQLSGWTPYSWEFAQGMETGAASRAEIPPVPATIPGSVQLALREAGILPDWNDALHARDCEWVENRHWIFKTDLPKEWIESGKQIRLRCLGLDYAGSVLINGTKAGTFCGSFTPCSFDLTPHLGLETNRLAIGFECPPRWLGQLGHTSRMKEWKPRFNYTWDWTSRLVQLGIWDDISLEVSDGDAFGVVACHASADAATRHGKIQCQGTLRGEGGEKIHLSLDRNGTTIRKETIAREAWEAGFTWDQISVELWHPNGTGDQPLYTLSCQLVDAAGTLLDEASRTIGFKQVDWESCRNAPPEADPWICVVNGEALFLQGVNWTPIRPNFADVTAADYRQRLELYRDLGCNIMRVWGGAFLEKQIFYDLCDELGLLVWQEFPLSSSGIDNWPPEDERSISDLAAIAHSYIERRRHHVSLLLWCGGNELQGALDGGKQGIGKPIDSTHPLMKRLAQVVSAEDPERRFLPTSSSGPRFAAEEADFGKGLHWDVHGPWIAAGDLDGDWKRYWENDDALFRSETGAPGASPVDIIREFKGPFEEMPATVANPLWRRTSWWIEWPEYLREHGAEPTSLETYVAWSQERQSRALVIAARACKDRFPECGGFIVWMGHDSFPCTANTAIVDFHGRPKPAALALREVFREK